MGDWAVPSQRQLEFLDWEFGVFFHFGIRSFYLGHEDWDGRPMDAAAFNPDRLDCRQWIRTIKEAGASYAILVCKHHDGFANWPTKYSDYSVASAPWKDGKGDVVREFVDACREYGVKVGLYYSPAQWGGQTAFAEGREYDDYFIHQIGELLTNYGRIDYLWFDSCGSEGHVYDRGRIIAAIRSAQPDILIFQMWDPDTRWIGNEDGYADMSNPNASEGGFLPAECDFMMRDTWFDCALNEDKVKSVEELVGIYEMSVGRGANFLINIGPDRHGLLPEKDAARLLEFGAEIRRRYGHPLEGFGAPEEERPGCFSIAAQESALVNRVVLSEDLAGGERVEAFEIYAHLPSYKQQRVCVYRGGTIGHKAICVFPTIRTARLTVETHGREAGRIAAMRVCFVAFCPGSFGKGDCNSRRNIV